MEPRLVFRQALAGCSIAILAAAAIFCTASSTADAAPVVPRQTKVLLLQPVDATVDSAVLQPLRQKIIRLRQQYEFIRRQFAVMGEGMAAQAAAIPPALDLKSTETRSAEALDEMARRAGADWVVSIVVREIKADPSDGAGFKVHSTLLVRIRDAGQHAWLADLTYVGHLAGGGSPGWLFIKSLDAATGEALAGILASYPPTVQVSRDGSIVDYLAGQRTPFIGDPGAPPFRPHP